MTEFQIGGFHHDCLTNLTRLPHDYTVWARVELLDVQGDDRGLRQRVVPAGVLGLRVHAEVRVEDRRYRDPVMLSGSGKGVANILAQIGWHAGWYAPGVYPERLAALAALGARWHTNDMVPWCPHQHAAGWHLRPIDPTLPLGSYGRFIPGSRENTWNMLAWVKRTEHPEGLMGEPCPECGYRYGTQWLWESLPEPVLAWVQDTLGVPITRGEWT